MRIRFSISASATYHYFLTLDLIKSCCFHNDNKSTSFLCTTSNCVSCGFNNQFIQCQITVVTLILLSSVYNTSVISKLLFNTVVRIFVNFPEVWKTIHFFQIYFAKCFFFVLQMEFHHRLNDIMAWSWMQKSYPIRGLLQNVSNF